MLESWRRASRITAMLTAIVLVGTQAIGEPDGPSRQGDARRAILPDDAVRSGVLPNGLRYAIMRAANPVHGLSIRLGIDVGSYEEQEPERGFAHFVEHMAFRTTRSAPDGMLDGRFAALGVAFGRDQNAATTLTSTTYRLDFASADDKGIDQGLGWLRDVADGIVFADPVVAVERGVVMAERQNRDSPESAVREAVARFQVPGSRFVSRDPKGVPETLIAARAETLRGFYERWYRPEDAVLVVVGDQPSDTIEAKIRAAFGSWQAKGPAPVRARPAAIDLTRANDAIGVAAPAMPPAFSACRLRPPAVKGEDEMVRFQRDVRNAIWRAILAERFKAQVNAGKSGLLSATITGQDTPEFASTCLVGVPIGAAWEKALASAQAELRRFVGSGPTETEVEAQISGSRAILRGAIQGAGARAAAPLADSIVARMLDHRPILSPREAMHAFDVAVEDLDPATVKAAVAADWAGSGPLLAVVTPAEVDRAQIRTAWTTNEHATALAAFVDRESIPWPYTDFGRAGAVVDRAVIADPGFVRLRFANNVVMNFKQTTLEPNGIELRVRFGAGRREIADDHYVGTMLGSSLFIAGGLGRMSVEDIERSLRDTSWEFQFQVGPSFFQFGRSTSKANLKPLLQVMTAFMTDPGFRPGIDERLPSAIDIMYRMVGSQPNLVLNEAILTTVDPTNPERLPPADTILALRSADFARLLRPPLTEAPIEVTLVGDIDEAMATRLVAATFGALPPRPSTDRDRVAPHFLHFPDKPLPMIRTTHAGPADRAAARLVWPLYVAVPARRREEYAIKLLAGVFDDELRHRARVEMGKTYSPSVTTAMPDDDDQGVLAVQVESEPASIEMLVAESEAVAARLAKGEITADQIDAVRKPLLSQQARAG